MDVPDADAPLRHINRARLRRLLADRFDAGELRTLCFDLQIDYDDLPDAGKANKARDLVAYMERHARLPQLIVLGRKLRPDVPWDQAFDRAPGTPLGRLRAGVGVPRRWWMYAGMAGLALVILSFLAWRILRPPEAMALSFVSKRPDLINVRDILADGDVWIATTQGGISRYYVESEAWQEYGTLEGRVTEPLALARDPTGRLWVGDRAHGLSVLSPDGEVEWTYPVNADSEVSAVALTVDGAAWVGAWDTVHHRDVQGTWSVITPPLTSAYAIEQITLDVQGHAWFALYGAGIARLEPETSRWTVINQDSSCAGATQCLLSNFVNALYIDAQGRKWIGTEEGLSIMVDKGTARRWHNFTAADGLPASDVHAIVADDAGRFYVGTAAGLAVMDGMPQMLALPDFPAPLRDTYICALAFQPINRTLWVGTLEQGLSVWSTAR